MLLTYRGKPCYEWNVYRGKAGAEDLSIGWPTRRTSGGTAFKPDIDKVLYETDIFVDTSGFLRVVGGKDPQHAKAAALLKAASGTGAGLSPRLHSGRDATLLKVRGMGHLLHLFSRPCRSRPVGLCDRCGRLQSGAGLFLADKDKDYSLRLREFSARCDRKNSDAPDRRAHFRSRFRALLG